MARAKANAPLQRGPSETFTQNGTTHASMRRRPSVAERIENSLEQVAEAAARDPEEQKQSGLLALAWCVGGIYASL